MRLRLAVAVAVAGAALTIAGAARAGDARASVGPPTPAGEDKATSKAPLDPVAGVRSVFERRLRFCHDPTYPLTVEEAAWCDLLPPGAKGADARCPRLAEACARGATAELIGGRRLRRAAITGPTLPPIVAWVLLGVGVLLLVSRLARQAIEQGASRAPEREGPSDDDGARTAAARARVVETDVLRLLARARAAAAAGDFARGVADAYAALLRKLEGAGVVRVEVGTTNGDHVRAVGRKLPAVRAPMQDLVRAVERVQFGGVPPDEAAYRSVHDGVVRLLAERLSTSHGVVGVVGVGVVVVAALGLAALGGCQLDREDWDESPSGRAAVLALLARDGFEARERVLPLADLGDSAGQLVLTPGTTVDKSDWNTLAAWVAEGGTLFVAGGPRELPEWIPVTISGKGGRASAPLLASGRLPSLVRRTAVVPPGPELKVAPPPVPETKDEPPPAATQGGAGGMEGRDTKEEEEEDDEDEPSGPTWPTSFLTRGDTIYAVEQTYGAGRIVVLADDRLFTNASLLVAENAALLLDLLREGGKRVEIAGELVGLVSPNPLASVTRGALAPALLQLGLLVLLFFFHRGAHFGRPADPIETARRAFAEHARAIGLLYARARAARHAVGLYGAYALERLRERLRLPGGKGLGAVAEAVAARSGRPLGEVMRVLVEARPDAAAMAAEPDAATRAADLVTMREIATLLAETGGARERTVPRET